MKKSKPDEKSGLKTDRQVSCNLEKFAYLLEVEILS